MRKFEPEMKLVLQIHATNATHSPTEQWKFHLNSLDFIIKKENFRVGHIGSVSSSRRKG